MPHLLTPNRQTTAHDLELSEQYSDLMALRYFLWKNDIFDSGKEDSVFTEDEYNKLLDTEGGEFLRYLKYHTKQQVIDAINEVATNKTEQFITPTASYFEQS